MRLYLKDCRMDKSDKRAAVKLFASNASAVISSTNTHTHARTHGESETVQQQNIRFIDLLCGDAFSVGGVVNGVRRIIMIVVQFSICRKLLLYQQFPLTIMNK